MPRKSPSSPPLPAARRPNATYSFADGRQVRARTDEACDHIAKRYMALYHTDSAPRIIGEQRDREDAPEGDEDEEA